MQTIDTAVLQKQRYSCTGYIIYTFEEGQLKGNRTKCDYIREKEEFIYLAKFKLWHIKKEITYVKLYQDINYWFKFKYYL